MKIKVNMFCNVKTGPDTSNPRSKVEVTIPHLRANVSPAQARELAQALLEAAAVADREAAKDQQPANA